MILRAVELYPRNSFYQEYVKYDICIKIISYFYGN